MRNEKIHLILRLIAVLLLAHGAHTLFTSWSNVQRITTMLVQNGRYYGFSACLSGVLTLVNVCILQPLKIIGGVGIPLLKPWARILAVVALFGDALIRFKGVIQCMSWAEPAGLWNGTIIATLCVAVAVILLSRPIAGQFRSDAPGQELEDA
jgi:hypothetical protein